MSDTILAGHGYSFDIDLSRYEFSKKQESIVAKEITSDKKLSLMLRELWKIEKGKLEIKNLKQFNRKLQKALFSKIDFIRKKIF